MKYGQQDPRWANVIVGTGTLTIRQIGCTITSIGNCLGLTPVEVNDRLKALPKRGDLKFTGYAYDNLVYWERLSEAFPGVTFKRVWSYINDEVASNVPYVIVESSAAPIGGTGKHWTEYLGEHKLYDPWANRERPTTDFPNPTGYCLVIPNPTLLPTPVIIEPTQEILTGIDKEVGFKPTQEGQVVQRSNVNKTWKSFLIDGKLVWVEQLHQETTVNTNPLPTYETAVTQPGETTLGYTGEATDVPQNDFQTQKVSNSLFDLIISFIQFIKARIKLK